ncbi:type I pantothenate kinase [Actinomyces trachealis]|uniref:type I pantothenate kinase n=1 Tax=Actinomyces trachealis TaxID=2763540 RepID=UPI001892C54A
MRKTCLVPRNPATPATNLDLFFQGPGFPSPYIELRRDQWRQLASTAPLPLTQADVEKLRGLGDPIDLAEVDAVYRPLTALLQKYISTTRERAAQTSGFLGVHEPLTPFVVAVAGSVAVGKSTTARLIAHMLSRFEATPRVDLVTTDGFLLPNAVLEARGLTARKGFPESYDRRALLDFVASVKSGAERVKAPVYSHSVYDVMPDEYVVVERPDVLVLEGLNVLQPAPRGRAHADGEPASALAVSDFIDFSIYVDADPEDIRRWYLDRFLTLKRTAFQAPASYFRRYAAVPDDIAVAAANEVWESVNLANLRENIEPTRGRATLVLCKDGDHHMSRVLLRKS